MEIEKHAQYLHRRGMLPSSRLESTPQTPKAQPAVTPGQPAPATPPDSEIRKHYFLDRYVIVAPRRNQRPDSFGGLHDAPRPRAEKAAFTKDESIFEVKDLSGNWRTKVVKNLYSALSMTNEKAFGSQEVVVDTPDFHAFFSELSVDHMEAVFEAYLARYKVLIQEPGIRYVVIFKNSGPRAGASIGHSHSQIVALPFIPPTVEMEAAAFDEYVRKHGSSPFADIIRWEQEQKERVIFEDDQAIAISPYAVREAFGVWILPKTPRPRFCDLSAGERHSIAIMLKKITEKLDSAQIDYNFFLQDSLPGEEQHFHLKIEPRPNIWAGFELSTGVIINPIAPEFAAKWYKGEA